MSENSANLKFFLLTVLLAVASVGVILLYSAPIAAFGDQVAYFAAGKFIERGYFDYHNFVNLEYVNSFFAINDPSHNQVFVIYPPGYPALLALTAKIFGSGAEMYFTPIISGVSVLLMYALGRLFLPAAYAFAGAFLLAFSPTFLTNAIIKNTHSTGVFLTLAAIVSLLAATRGFRGKIRELPFIGAWLCGFFLGCNVAVRYADFWLLLAPLAYVLTAPRLRYRYVLLATGVVGALIPLLALAWYQWHAFGSPFKTGYHLFNIGTGASDFSLAYIAENVWVYLPGLINNSFGLAAGILGFAALLKFRRANGVPNWFWAAWIVPPVIFYHLYFWASDDALYLSMRFWEPIFPALIIIGLLGARRLIKTSGPRLSAIAKRGIIALLLLAQIIWSVKTLASDAERIYVHYKRAERQVYFAEQTLPAGAFVFFSRPLNRMHVDELVARQKWHLFSDLLFSMGELRVKTAEEKTAAAGKAEVFQDARRDAILQSSPEQMTASFLRTMTAARARGVGFYYFGNVEQFPEFQEKAARYFSFGEPVFYDDFAPLYLMFPPSARSHNVEQPAAVKVYPEMLIAPMKLK